MLGQSGVLTLLGMAVVFGFLVILIVSVSLTGKFIHAVGADKDVLQPPSAPAGKTAPGGNAAVTAAISAAVNEYKKSHYCCFIRGCSKSSVFGTATLDLRGCFIRPLVCAKYWVEECAPEEFRFRLRPAGEQAELSAREAAGVRALRDTVIRRIESFAEDKPCAEAIYKAAEEAGLDGKALFRAAYQALIGKDQGPRLANFLRSIEKERLLIILEKY
jgi:sodium pump decarboxylase gamma subunit